MVTLKLDLLQTLSLAAVLYFVGLQLRQRIALLDRLNIPAAVVGGLLFALLVLVGRDRFLTVQLDTSAQPVLSVAFFSSIGMGASLALLRAGGLQVVIFLLIAIAFCFVQNFLGIAIARGFGEHPLLGVLAGSVTLVGGPATGMAFAPMLEQAGLVGAGTLALTSATFGIVCGGLTGTPVGTWLIHRYHLTPSALPGTREAEEEPHGPQALVVPTDREDPPLILNMIVLAAAMGLGSILSRWFAALEWTLPAYIGAMIIASIFRNVDDRTGWLKIDPAAMDFVGGFALNIFLVVALMDLKLWQLAGQALPLFVILAAQVVAHRDLRAHRLLPGDGPGLRFRGHVGRLRRLRPRHHGQRGGQHAGAGDAVRSGAPRLPGGAAGRRLLHRLRQRHHHHVLRELAALTAAP